MKSILMFILSFVTNVPLLDAENCNYVTFSENDVTMKVQTIYNVTVTASNVQGYSSVLNFFVQHPNVIQVYPKYLIVDDNISYDMILKAITAGKSDIKASLYCLEKFSISYIKVSVYHSTVVEVLSYITGWLYLLMWSTANCPQIWSNYKRKSIAGLSVDFVVLHCLGHIYYLIFNVVLYYVPLVKWQYSLRFPESAQPVAFSDVVYAAVVAILASIILIQAFIYGIGEQSPSRFLKIFLLFCGCTKITAIVLISKNALEWLDFIYICSYLKLAITIKYVPQVVTNCKRKSTEGFSIIQVFLDLCGGLLSITHMIFIAYNYNDWPIFYENCTKFGLGLLSVCFDLIFIVQHYILFNKDEIQEKQRNVSTTFSSSTV